MVFIDLEPDRDLKVLTHFKRRVWQKEAETVRAQVHDFRVEAPCHNVVTNQACGNPRADPHVLADRMSFDSGGIFRLNQVWNASIPGRDARSKSIDSAPASHLCF
jgi:hypothetical protein